MNKLAYAVLAGVLFCTPASALQLNGSDAQFHFVELPGSCEVGGCIVIGTSGLYDVELDETTGQLSVCGLASGVGSYVQGNPSSFSGIGGAFADCVTVDPQEPDGGNQGGGSTTIILFEGTPQETLIQVFGFTDIGPNSGPDCVAVFVVFPDGTVVDIPLVCTNNN